MRKKLFTPLNVGSFDLRHRVVVDWGQAFADGPDFTRAPYAAMQDAPFSGGLVIFDPGRLVWPARTAPTPHACADFKEAWRRLLEDARTARQTVLARLTANVTSPPSGRQDPVFDLTQQDIENAIQAFVDAAQRARSAGFDGVELDGTIGSMTELFLRSSTNTRSDRYGGPNEHRINFLMELLDGLTGVFGRERVGVRLSPSLSREAEAPHGGVYDEVLRSLHAQEIAYVHLVDTGAASGIVSGILRLSPLAEALRRIYPGILITSGQLPLKLAIELVEARWADAICFSVAELSPAFIAQLRRAWWQGTDA